MTAAATIDGRVYVNGLMDPEGGAYFLTALGAFMQPDPDDTPPELRRTAGQRRADALVQLSKTALRSGLLPTVAGQRPHVTVRVTADTLAGTPGAPPAELDLVGAIGRTTAQADLG